MRLFEYISMCVMPIVIFVIIAVGVFERKKVFDLFIDGAKEGFEISVKLIPTLVGIFFSVGLLRSSGTIDSITKLLGFVTNIFKFPSELIPLALVRPISGSAAIGVASDIMKTYGVDSLIGKTASVIMGSTETTFYTIAVYTSIVKIKKTRGLVWAALSADLAGIIAAVVFCRIMS